MSNAKPAMPHGPITEIVPDVYLVSGTFRMAPGVTFGRNMTIVREGRHLTLINAIRLSPEGEAELERLGVVKNVLRIGWFHGGDDAYYASRFEPTMWAPPGMRHAPGVTYARALGKDGSPVSDATVVNFERGKLAESALVVARSSGVLVTCDSFQNWETFDGASFLAKVIMRGLKFGPAIIGPSWAKEMGHGVRADFERLLTHPFAHALTGHGAPLRERAHEALERAFDRFAWKT